MSKQKLIITGLALLAVVGIYFLPKGVVKKAGGEQAVRDQMAGKSSTPTDTTQHTDTHTDEPQHEETPLSESEMKYLAALRKRYQQAKPSQKAQFADSLAKRFAQNNQFDSVAVYTGQLANHAPTAANLIKAGDAMFDAAGFALKADKIAYWTEHSRQMYQKAIEADKNNLDAKAKLAMTYVDTDNPMQAIGMLREVVSADPKNETAIYNLGLLSMRSNQYEKAIGRFEELLKINPKHLKATYFLAMSYKQAGKKEKAIEFFNKVKQLDKDPAVQESVEENLAELQAL